MQDQHLIGMTNYLDRFSQTHLSPDQGYASESQYLEYQSYPRNHFANYPNSTRPTPPSYWDSPTPPNQDMILTLGIQMIDILI